MVIFAVSFVEVVTHLHLSIGCISTWVRERCLVAHSIARFTVGGNTQAG